MTRLALIVMLGVSATVLMATAGADPARAPQPMPKGMELYSWRDTSGNWRYSLLPGTNRLKTKDEIVSEDVSVTNVAKLKQRLSALAAGEQVFWFDFDAPGFSLPDSAIVADVVTYARVVQVTVQVPQ